MNQRGMGTLGAHVQGKYPHGVDQSVECKDESIDDMLTEQRIQMEQDGTIKPKRVINVNRNNGQKQQAAQLQQ